MCAHFFKFALKFYHQDREALCVWDFLGEGCAPFSKLIYMERALLYISAGHRQNVPGNIGFVMVALKSWSVHPLFCLAWLKVCACCIILVENRLFLGRSRHMASLGVTDFQNVQSLYFVFQMNLVYTTSSFSKFYKQSTVSEVR